MKECFTKLRSFGFVMTLLVCWSGISLAQSTITVSGKITFQDGSPAPGASVTVKGTSTGTVSSPQGTYQINNVPVNGTLVFKLIGSAVKEAAVNNRTAINIVLEDDVAALSEVVVVGYGTQKKVNLSGAVSAITIDEKISSRSLTNVSSGLSGLVPGLMVQQSSGFAGFDGASLRVRGLGSVNNSNPLVVVDGMPDVDINRIDMNDIESISVLKDAASAAVYGSRGANGVILIKTKSGKRNEDAAINYTGSYGISNVSHFYDYLADYPRAMTLARRSSLAGNSTPSYSDGTIEQWLAMGLVDPILFPNTNQFDEMFRTGGVQNHNISASGGSDKFNFYASGGMMKQKGLQINNDFNRYNTRVNIDYNIRKSIKIGTRMDGQWSDLSFPREAGLETAGLRYAIAGILNRHPVTGEYGGGMAYGENGSAGNALAEYSVYHNERTRQEYNGSVYGEWEVIPGLKVRSDFALRYYNQFGKSFNDPTIQWNFQTGTPARTMIASNAGISQNFQNGFKTLFQTQVTYEKEIVKGHNLSVFAATTEEYWFARNLNGSRDSRIHPSLSELDGALTAIQAASGAAEAEGLRSYIGRLNYVIKDRYILEGNFRFDGSSKFAKGNQYGFFPSASAAWRISEEEFFSPLKSIVNQLKIRASIGELGNNSGVNRAEQQRTLATTNYYLGNVVAKGFALTKMINPNLTWESTQVTNLGLDMAFLKNQLTVEIDAYDRLTTDMIRPSDFSTLLSGYNAPRINIGNLRNRGLEMNLGWRSKVNQVEYGANLNASINKNKLEKWNEFLPKGWTYLDMPYHFVYGMVAYDDLAQSWNDIYNAPYQGNFPFIAPGDVLIKDINGDGQITDEDRKATKKMRETSIGNLGLTLYASWKGFDVNMLFQSALGRNDYWLDDYNTSAIPSNNRYAFQEMHWNDAWSLDNRNAFLPRLIQGQGGNRNRNESTYWLQNASYLRMKNLQLGYTLPKSVLSKLTLKGARIYFSAENLFTITKWKGIDPEKYFSNDPYPQIRTYAFGVNIGL